MKKYLIIFIAVVTTSFFVGCDSDDDFTPPNYVTFGDVTDLSNKLNISVIQDETAVLDLPVFSTRETSSERIFNVVVDEASTLDPSAYTIPETVTVPGSTNEGVINVEINGAGIANEGDVLVLRLEGEQDLFVGDPLIIDLLKVCPYDASPWIGTYDVSEVFTGGDNAGLSLAAAFGEAYQVELNANPEDNTGGSLILNNSEGFNMYYADGTVLTFAACDGSVILSSANIADFADLTVTSSSYDEATGTITVEGELGVYGPYQFIFTKRDDAAGADISLVF